MDKKVFVVFKTHFDIGFTELAEKVIEKYGKVMLKDVIKTCKDTQALGKDKKYVWTMSTWPLIQSLKEENADPHDIEEAKELMKQGQITWHGLPFTTHTEFCGLEDLIYGLQLGNRLADTYGFKSISAKMTDVPGHTWILPTLLANNGIKFLHLGCNPSAVPPNVPRLFWWEGPDGSRVLTFYSKGSYGSQLVPPKDWPYPVWLALMQTNDNIGPQDSNVIQALENELRDKDPAAQMIVGRLDDFYNELMQYNLDIPVIKKDLADTWIHGVGTYPIEVKQLRANRRKIKDVEILNLLSRQDDINEKIDTVYENSLLFGEHTWGLDVKTHMGWSRAYEKKWFCYHKGNDICKKMEKSWDEQRQRVNKACKITNDLYTALTQNTEQKSDSYTIYNTTGVSGDHWVLVDTSAKSLLDARDGSPLSQRSTKQGREFLIKDMPAVGTVQVLESELPIHAATDLSVSRQAGHIIVENTYFKLCVDESNGTVESIIDKRNDKEWVDNTQGENFFDYRYDIYSLDEVNEFIRNYTYRFTDWWVNDIGRMGYPDCKHQVYRPVTNHVDVNVVDGEATIVIHKSNEPESVAEFGNAKELSLSISLKAYSDVLDFHVSLPQKQETPFIEAGHITFPLNLANPSFFLNKIGSRVNADSDICDSANHAMHCLDKYVDLTNGNDAMCIVSHDVPLLSIGEQKIYQFQPQSKEEKPVIFFNCFNNWWGTNFPQWIGGDLNFQFSMFAHKNEDNISSKVTQILNQPVAVKAAKPISNLHSVQFGNQLELLRLSQNADGSYLLHLLNTAPYTIQEKVTIQNLISANRCNFDRKLLEEYAVKADTLELCAKPNEIICIEFRLNE